MTREERHVSTATSHPFPILGNSPAASSRNGELLHTPTGSGRRRLAALVLLLSGAIVPTWIAGALATSPPRTRDIHIEAYRYGFSPSRVHVNRGDRLRLSFSTRDTGQSFFLQDYDLHVSITPGDSSVLLQRLSRADDPPERVAAVEFVAGIPGWQGWLFTKSTFRNHTYNGPLHGTERGDLVVGPNLLLHGSLGLLCAIPLAGLILAGRGRVAGSGQRLNLFQVFPRLKKAVRAPSFQFNLILPMLAVFWFIILAGLLGTKVAGRNAAPMIIWVLWLSALIVVLVPVFGRMWCTVCPLPVIGEWWQRARIANNRGTLTGRRLIWPAWLSNAWPRVLLFLLLGTFSTTLVVLPPATSWMLIGLMVMAIVASFFPEQRLFCRYLCPINSYISLYSTTGRVMVRAVASEPCEKCTEKFCLTGSAKGWGCPYGLCVGELERNNDCGACMECVKTCAYDNVAVFWRTSGRDTTVASYGEAWQAIVMFALACLYCFVNLGAWDWIREWTDIVDKQNWGTFLVYAVVVWIACLGILPLIWYLLTRAGIAISGMALDAGTQFRATTAAFIPIGLACWISFALATFLSMMTFVLQSLSDPFNWGWNLLGMAGSPWHIPFSPAIPAMQVACILAGCACAFATLYRCWLQNSGTRRRALLGALPPGGFLWVAGGGMIWFFAG
jgi:polyferredoxin